MGAKITAAECRIEAELCRAAASDTDTPEDKAYWLRLSADWLALAGEVETRPKARLKLVPRTKDPA
jgi:hypothetical protein